MSLPQAGLHAGAEAAVASLLAHYPRQIDGLGQRIVVNMQACIVWTLMNEQAMPILHGDHLTRSGVYVGSAGRAAQDGVRVQGRIHLDPDRRRHGARQLDQGADRLDGREGIRRRLDEHQGLDFVDPRRVHEDDRSRTATRSTTSKTTIAALFADDDQARDLRAGTQAADLSRAGRDRRRYRRTTSN